MNNSLVPKKSFSFLESIKNFWKTKILQKFNNKSNIQKTENTEKVNHFENKMNFANDLKVDIEYSVNKKNELENFIEKIEENPNLLDNLSNERLDKLIEYYEKITKEKQNKIEKLKLSLN